MEGSAEDGTILDDLRPGAKATHGALERREKLGGPGVAPPLSEYDDFVRVREKYELDPVEYRRLVRRRESLRSLWEARR